jgi:hypothetical protein
MKTKNQNEFEDLVKSAGTTFGERNGELARFR